MAAVVAAATRDDADALATLDKAARGDDDAPASLLRFLHEIRAAFSPSFYPFQRDQTSINLLLEAAVQQHVRLVQHDDA